MKIRSLLLACIGMFWALESEAQMKVDWLYKVQSTDSINQGASAVDCDGNVYTAGSFVGTIVAGDDTISSPSPAIFLLKLDPKGIPVWIVKTPTTTPLLQLGTIHKVVVRHERVYTLGSIDKGGNLYGYLSTSRTDGTVLGHSDQTTLTFADIDADSSKNAYLVGSAVGSPATWFLSKSDSMGALCWVYYSTDTSRGLNVKYSTNGTVSVVGKYQTSMKVTDVLNSPSINFSAIGGVGAWNIFTARYSSTNGQVLSAVGSACPLNAGGMPEFGSALSSNGSFVMASAKADGWGNSNLYFQKKTSGFASTSNLSPSPVMACSFAPEVHMYQSEYQEGGAINVVGVLCGPSTFKIDGTGKITDTLHIPTTWTSTGVFLRYLTFDAQDVTYVTAGVKGVLSYRDSGGVKSTSSAKDAGYVAKLHECTSSEVSIVKTGDTLKPLSVKPGLTYQWFKDGSALVGNGPYYVPTTSGSYTLKVLDAWMCQSTSSATYVTVSINELTLERISLYPNPVTATVTVSGIPENTSGEIFDLNGKNVHSVHLNQGDNSLDLTSLPAGIYVFKFPYGIKKLVKL